MNELSGITGSNRLMSKPRASMAESVQPERCIEASAESQELQNMEMKMEQINHAFSLVREIRATLESALQDLIPN